MQSGKGSARGSCSRSTGRGVRPKRSRRMPSCATSSMDDSVSSRPGCARAAARDPQSRSRARPTCGGPCAPSPPGRPLHRPTRRARRGGGAPPGRRAARHRHGAARRRQDPVRSRVANDLAAEYADGVDFVSFTDVHDVSGISTAVAATLRLDARREQPPLDQIAASLRERELLMVLNDFAHGREGGAVSRLFSQARPELRLLVTSREPLRLAGSMSTGSTHSPRPRRDAPGRARPGGQARFPAHLENDAAVAEICRRLDNLPLTLELAAACLRAFTPEAVLARLDDSLSLLTAREHEFPVTPGHRTLREALGRSYDGLTAPEQRILREVSAFREGFDGAAARDVAGPRARSSRPGREEPPDACGGERNAAVPAARGDSRVCRRAPAQEEQAQPEREPAPV